jgi:hypothetical protein
MTGERTVLSVEGLRKYFPIRKGILRRVVGNVKAVDDVSFKITHGETLSLVGESGCGKTTTSRCILRAIRPTAGAIRFNSSDGEGVDVAGLSRGELRPLRRQMQMIFQDPYSSLNPRMTIADIIGEPLLVNGIGDLAERRRRIAELLDLDVRKGRSKVDSLLRACILRPRDALAALHRCQQGKGARDVAVKRRGGERGLCARRRHRGRHRRDGGNLGFLCRGRDRLDSNGRRGRRFRSGGRYGCGFRGGHRRG